MPTTCRSVVTAYRPAVWAALPLHVLVNVNKSRSTACIQLRVRFLMRAAAVRFAHQFPNSDSCSVDYVVIGLYILHNDLFVRTSDVAAKTPPSATNVPERTIQLA